MKKIVLTFLDGHEETVNCDYWSIRDGLLVLTMGRHDYRYIPISALSSWRATE
jgi:hypothetical protein